MDEEIAELVVGQLVNHVGVTKCRGRLPYILSIIVSAPNAETLYPETQEYRSVSILVILHIYLEYIERGRREVSNSE